jgi:MarR family transcriptional regulator, organic hydroperoxide resistance regulator
MYSLNESLAFLLNRSGAAVANAFTQELKTCNMTLPMWRVLAALWGNGDQSLGSLSTLTSVEISTLSRQVAALAKQELIFRSQSGINWRSINIGLTPAGRAVVERLLPAVERHERAALMGIGAADTRRLKQLLNMIYDNLIALDEVQSLELDD